MLLLHTDRPLDRVGAPSSHVAALPEPGRGRLPDQEPRDRLARVLECGEEEVACRAWKLRVHLASQYRGTERPLASLGAAGAVPARPSCPEFDPTNPWTQRFLDEEIPPRERIFLHFSQKAMVEGVLAGYREASATTAVVQSR